MKLLVNLLVAAVIRAAWVQHEVRWSGGRLMQLGQKRDRLRETEVWLKPKSRATNKRCFLFITLSKVSLPIILILRQK